MNLATLPSKQNLEISSIKFKNLSIRTTQSSERFGWANALQHGLVSE